MMKKSIFSQMGEMYHQEGDHLPQTSPRRKPFQSEYGGNGARHLQGHRQAMYTALPLT